MLTEKQLNEIREHLEKAQNPIFFFDNDNDGLTSYLQLRRFIGRGKGIPIRSHPDLNGDYFRRVKELNSDYIFILDKPIVSNDFLNQVREENIPLVWIDHHDVDPPTQDWVNYYNPFHNDKTSEPVSYMCYKITNKKEDIWIATIGCISDALVPDFYEEFEEKYPELAKKNPEKSPEGAFEVLFNSEIGKIARILDFSLKDSISNVVKMLKFMAEAKSPHDILEENPKTKQILAKYNEINEKYQSLLVEARQQTHDKLIFFTYGGPFSISANLANRIKYEFPDKYVVIGYKKDGFVNISLRGPNIRTITLESIKDLEGATGGGHEMATGARMAEEYIPEFKENIEKLIEAQ
jgi:single-stranded DNA-specific DHH superfamily exonuclease